MPFHTSTVRLTTAGLSAAPVTGRSYDVSDAAVAGLVLRIGARGSKRWLFRFSWQHERSRIKIGYFPKIGIAKAREIAFGFRNDLDDGIDPRRSARPTARRASPAGTVDHGTIARLDATPESTAVGISEAEDPLSIAKPDPDDKHSVHCLVYEFVELYVKPNREVPQEVIRILKKDVLPFFKERDARTITSREINDRLDAIVARGAPVMANRTAPIISQMFSFGVHRSIVASNPVSLLFKPGGKERSCDRVLTETECHAFLHGASIVCIAPVRYHTLMVLWLTLVRRGSLAKAEWCEFNFDRKEWRIPASHDKEKREHIVPLTDWAIEHLLELKKLGKGSRYVLPKQRKGKREIPCNAQIISRSVMRLRARFQVIGIDFAPRSMRPMVDAVTPDRLESAACVLKCLLDAIKPLMARLHSGLAVCFRLATNAANHAS